MTALAEYLKRLYTEKVLLVDIDPDGAAPVYISDTAYFTEPSDAVANQPYFPIIVEGGVPRLSRKIQEVWGGQSVPAWGPLTLATKMAGGVDLANADIRDKVLRLSLTGPRNDIPWADRAIMLEGVIGKRSGNPDEGVTIEVLDRQAQFNAIDIPTAVYDGTETANFPSSNIGKAKPLCLGTCANITPVLIDTLNLIYQTNDGTINDVTAAYDDGVSLTKVAAPPAAGEFSVDAAAATITLGITPSGPVTCDVQGMKDGTTWLSSTTQIIDWLSRTYGNVVAGDIDITGLPGDAIGIYINSRQRLADVITRLMKGIIGWWGFTRQSKLRARLFEVPATGGETFSETSQLSDVKWDEERDVVWSVPLLYRRNWTRNEQPATAVDLNTQAWLASEGNESRVDDLTVQSNYPYAVTARRIDTYFDSKAPAEIVASRAIVLFGTPRKRTTVTVPFVDPPLELGSSITLSDTGDVDGDHVITGMVDLWDGEIPLLELGVWG